MRERGQRTGGKGFGNRSAGPPRPKRRPQVPAAMLRRLHVVHEDRDILVVDKPPGLLSASPPGEGRDNLFDLVKAHARGPRNKPSRVWIIHRLDKEASGLLVFAKTEKAYEWLKEDFRAKRVHRLYLAVVEGDVGGEQRHEGTEGQEAGEPARDGATDPPAPKRVVPRQMPAGTIQSFIREGEESESATSVGLGDVAKEAARHSAKPWHGATDRPRGRSVRDRAGAHGSPPRDPGAPKLAVTHWRALATGKGRSLLQLRLETGRKNQIRVHMQEFKHPIAGDWRYGSTSDPLQRLCLHAAELGFTHPATGKAVRFHSPAPAGFYGLVGVEPPAEARASRGQGVEGSASAELTERQGLERQPDSTPATSRHLDTSAPSPDTSWDAVAPWYDALIEEERSDHFSRVIVPGAMRLLRIDVLAGGTGEPHPPPRVLDIACGQGAFVRQLAGMGVETVGVDASPRLIEAARRRGEEPAPGQGAGGPAAAPRFIVGDARELESIGEPLGADERPFDAVTCIMALMNIDPLEPVLRGAAAVLRPGGIFVAVMLHPAFRSPGQTGWGWEGRGDEREERAETRERRMGPKHPRPSSSRFPSAAPSGPPGVPARQYRRVDGYLSPGQFPIVMNPGKASHGAAPVTTWTFHRPLQAYAKAFAEAGFLIETLEEWPSMRRSQPGPRAAEENRARREIPMFLGVRAMKRQPVPQD